MNGFSLPLYCFSLFFHRSPFDCSLLKGEVYECHRAENQLPKTVHRQPSFWLSFSDFYHILASEVLIASKCSRMWLLCISLGTGPCAKEAVTGCYMGPGAHPPQLSKWFHFLAVWPWENYLTPLGTVFSSVKWLTVQLWPWTKFLAQRKHLVNMNNCCYVYV